MLAEKIGAGAAFASFELFYGGHQRYEVHWLQTLEAAKIAALESARVTLSPSPSLLCKARLPQGSNQRQRAEARQDAKPLVSPLPGSRKSCP